MWYPSPACHPCIFSFSFSLLLSFTSNPKTDSPFFKRLEHFFTSHRASFSNVYKSYELSRLDKIGVYNVHVNSLHCWFVALLNNTVARGPHCRDPCSLSTASESLFGIPTRLFTSVSVCLISVVFPHCTLSTSPKSA